MSKPIREFWISPSKIYNEETGKFDIPSIDVDRITEDPTQQFIMSTTEGIHVIEYSAYQRILDANKKLRDALEIICNSNHGKDCDLIADKVAKLALSEASKIEGGL